MLSCENTCPHGGLRSPWIPWDMGPGQGHMSHGLGPKPLGWGARRARPGLLYVDVFGWKCYKISIQLLAR